MSAAIIAVVVILLVAIAAAAAFFLLNKPASSPPTTTSPPANNSGTPQPPAPANNATGAGYDTAAVPGFAKLGGYSFLKGDITDLCGNVISYNPTDQVQFKKVYRANVSVDKCADITKAMGSAAMGFIYDRENSRCQPMVPPSSKPPPQITKTVTYIKNGDKSFIEFADQTALPTNMFLKVELDKLQKNEWNWGVGAAENRGLMLTSRRNDISTADACKTICGAQNADGLSAPCHAAHFIENTDPKTGTKVGSCALMSATRKLAYDTYIRT